ncbi:MAG: succinate dehydrogenase assembly factor 2 [Paracoccaceae bacterium]
METAQARLKRLAMRSWRRGTKEMDLILGPYSDAHLSGMDEGSLQRYDSLLNENDQDLYQWVSGQGKGPAEFASLLQHIIKHTKTR